MTISASYAALGSEIGPRVAARLGVPFCDRAIPVEVAQRLQVPLQEAIDADEHAQSGVARLIAAAVDALPQYGAQPPVAGESLDDEDRLRDTTAAVMRDLAAKDGGVFLGRGGMVVLRDHPAALHVRLDGGEEGRLRHAIARGVPADAVHRQLWQTDRAREAYMRSLYGVDVHDSSLYDLVLDTTRLPEDGCVDAIVDAALALAAAAAAPPAAAAHR